MRHELDYFVIDGEIGGNQDWFTDWFMNVGGCGAVTACDVCIHLARSGAAPELYPYDPHALTKDDYISFSAQMKPFLHPRWRGIAKLHLYTDGIMAYASSKGCRLSARSIPGESPLEAAAEAIVDRIQHGMPVPYLLLRHDDPTYTDYEWHWFNLAGIDDTDGSLKVKTVTYGEAVWFDLESLWHTGRDELGGVVLLDA